MVGLRGKHGGSLPFPLHLFNLINTDGASWHQHFSSKNLEQFWKESACNGGMVRSFLFPLNHFFKINTVMASALFIGARPCWRALSNVSVRGRVVRKWIPNSGAFWRKAAQRQSGENFGRKFKIAGAREE